ARPCAGHPRLDGVAEAKSWTAGRSLHDEKDAKRDRMAEIRVPTLGESVTEATIGKWFKKAGDVVAVDEPLVELETDKVTIEVPAPAAGVLADVAVNDGDTVAVGALLGSIKEGAGGAPTKPSAKSAEPSIKPADSPQAAPPPKPAPAA